MLRRVAEFLGAPIRVTIAPREESELASRFPPMSQTQFANIEKLIHVELADLNQEAVALAKKIQKNFEELGV